MEKIKNLTRYVRSKNAGPFWVTVEMFFDTDENYCRVKNAKNVNPSMIAELYHTKKDMVKMFYCDDIKVIKFSFPRPHPSGWSNENDMHAGQQYVFLSELEVQE